MSHSFTSIIGAATGWGAKLRATEHGPDALKHYGLVERLQQEGFSVGWQETLYPRLRFANDEDIDPKECLPYVRDMCLKVFMAVRKSLEDKTIPCVLGGDHSIAIGTWSALTTALHAEGEFGLIWFDAHLDAHTPQTTPSNAIHGMPVACLLGEGHDQLKKLGSDKSKLNPEHIVIIGARSYEGGEHSLLKERGVKIYYMEDIHKRGFNTILDEAIKTVTHQTKGFGLSLDLDGFDPEVAPGVGSPSEGGLREEEVIPYLHKIRDNPQFKAFEITEFNPHRDKQLKTATLVHHIMRELLRKESS